MRLTADVDGGAKPRLHRPPISSALDNAATAVASALSHSPIFRGLYTLRKSWRLSILNWSWRVGCANFPPARRSPKYACTPCARRTPSSSGKMSLPCRPLMNSVSSKNAVLSSLFRIRVETFATRTSRALRSSWSTSVLFLPPKITPVASADGGDILNMGATGCSVFGRNDISASPSRQP